MQRRAENAGLEGERSTAQALGDAREACDSMLESGDQSFAQLGELLWDVVAAARAGGVDPEVALREHANEVRRAIEEGAQ